MRNRVIRLRCLVLERDLEQERRLASCYLAELNTETAARVSAQMEIDRLRDELARAHRRALIAEARGTP